MSIPNFEILKLRVLQQLKRKGTYGPITYRAIANSTGIKIGIVKYIAKQLISEGKVNINDLKAENGEKREESSTRVSPEIREQIIKANGEGQVMPKEENCNIEISIKTRKEYIERMLKGKAETNMAVAGPYIDYCRQNLNTRNLTPEDFEMLGDLIASDVSLMTADNIKLGILGFIRINKICLAKKFYEKCNLEVLKHLKAAMCTKEDLDEIEKELDDYEQKLQIYAKLRQGYPVEVILEETTVSETAVRRMANAVEKERQARKNKQKEGMEH